MRHVVIRLTATMPSAIIVPATALMSSRQYRRERIAAGQRGNLSPSPRAVVFGG